MCVMINRTIAIERVRCDIKKPIGDPLGCVIFGRDYGTKTYYVMEVEGVLPIDVSDDVYRIKRILEARQYEWSWTHLPIIYPAA